MILFIGHPSKHKTFVYLLYNVGPPLYKCYANVLCLLVAVRLCTGSVTMNHPNSLVNPWRAIFPLLSEFSPLTSPLPVKQYISMNFDKPYFIDFYRAGHRERSLSSKCISFEAYMNFLPHTRDVDLLLLGLPRKHWGKVRFLIFDKEINTRLS